MTAKLRAPRNKTLVLSDADRQRCSQALRRVDSAVSLAEVLDSTICQDAFEVLPHLPSSAFDLIVADPPYNLTKSFNGRTFKETDLDRYEAWLGSWLPEMRRLLKPIGSIYVCGDWRSSAAIHRVLLRNFNVRNRISWEREKGRGARSNWKNNTEDIWFATVSDRYVFNVDDVKLRRRVIAPYTDTCGEPKDWENTDRGKFRITHPSNIWTDLTVPFWSMPENTDHPTQKPEKLLAKIILASSNVGDVVFDPFLGSGTTSVVAKKLRRHWVGIEIDREFCCLAERRLELAEEEPGIQGYTDGVFWERNSLPDQDNGRDSRSASNRVQSGLFESIRIAK
ncbi:MAG: site-specific DNA-methyltransferase [Candidatus Coatesbacteria bacterium]|nr:site-specific DNA-methyltransferase [Candidatus Coatesbacteria bacterium]